MADLLTKDLIAYDPLSETTRKERTALLGLSILGVALVKVPLVPEKFAVFGVDFAKVNQSTFVSLYALVIGYYLVAFAIYAVTDYIAWRRQEVINAHEHTAQSRERDANAKKGPLDSLDDDIRKEVRRQAGLGLQADHPKYKGAASYSLAFAAARMRATFEFLLPIVFAIYTLVVLLTYVPKP